MELKNCSVCKLPRSQYKVKNKEFVCEKCLLRPVIVSTSQKFTVFGYTEDEAKAPVLTLERSRLVVYWSQETRGLWGLAAAGPAQGSKVSSPCTAVIRDALFVLECTPEAAAAFESTEQTW